MYLTKENLLANIMSIGKYFRNMTSPYSHPYDDERRAKSYVPMYHASQIAWYGIYKDEDTFSVLNYFNNSIKKIQTFESYKTSLLMDAVYGKLKVTEKDLRNPKEKYFYVTYKGDLFNIHIGDKLNRSLVERMANVNIPFAERTEKQLELSKEIGTLIPNYCHTVQTL